MKLAEIAELLNEPISTIHSRYTAALAALGKRMVSPCKTQNSKTVK
jgi:DNA-directed RNA polymerase specialized sigma24 family protein